MDSGEILADSESNTDSLTGCWVIWKISRSDSSEKW